MKTIRITIEEGLLEEVDKMAAVRNITRAAFIQDALRMALRRHRIASLEQQHAKGYASNPAKPDEISEWVNEQAWGHE